MLPRTTLASFARRLASESNPKLAMPRYGSPSTVATSISRSCPSTATRAASVGVGRDAEDAAEVVAAPAGDDRQRASRPANVRERPQEPVAPEPRDVLAGRDGRGRLLAGMVDPAGLDHPVGRPLTLELGHRRGSRLSARPPAAAGLTRRRKRRLTSAWMPRPGRRAGPRTRRARTRAGASAPPVRRSSPGPRAGPRGGARHGAPRGPAGPA